MVKEEGTKPIVEYGYEELVYKNKPVLRLFIVGDNRYQFFFGVAKANLILHSMGAIRDFVKKYVPDWELLK